MDISFAVQGAEIVGIAGLAGSGRSTLLKSLFGIVPRRTGKIRVGGSGSEADRAGKGY